MMIDCRDCRAWIWMVLQMLHMLSRTSNPAGFLASPTSPSWSSSPLPLVFSRCQTTLFLIYLYCWSTCSPVGSLLLIIYLFSWFFVSICSTSHPGRPHHLLLLHISAHPNQSFYFVSFYCISFIFAGSYCHLHIQKFSFSWRTSPTQRRVAAHQE